MDSESLITSIKSGCLIKISAIKLLLPKTLRSNSRNFLFLENKSKNDSQGNIFDYGYHALDYNRSLTTTKFFKKVLKNNYRKFKLKRGIILKDHLIPYNEKINNWPKELKILFPKKLTNDAIKGKLNRKKISKVFGKKFTNLAYEEILRSYPSINWSLKNGGKEEDFFSLVYPFVLIVLPLLFTVICLALPFRLLTATLRTLTLNFSSTAFLTTFLLFSPHAIRIIFLAFKTCFKTFNFKSAR